jgi:hypothetical protein
LEIINWKVITSKIMQSDSGASIKSMLDISSTKKVGEIDTKRFSTKERVVT